MPTHRRTGSARPTSHLQFRVLTTISLVIASITAFAGSVQAAPAQVGPVTYDVSTTATSLRLTVHNGSISTDNGILTIRNNAGAEKFRMPLSYRKEYLQFPIDARTAGNRTTLVPSRDAARSTPLIPGDVEQLRTTVAQQNDAPRTKRERDDQALARFNQELNAGMTISSLVGTVLGAIVGGVLGCAGGIVVGCLPFIPLGASIGALAGLALGGGGSVIVAAFNYFNTINSPFVPPRR